jgi:hypothetical protein
MPDFAANLSTMFTDLPFFERFDSAARCGFDAVELAFPYAFPKDEVAKRLHVHHLTLVMFNLPAGRWEEGERGIACHPDLNGPQNEPERKAPRPSSPRPLPLSDKGHRCRIFTPALPDYPAASVRDLCSGAYISAERRQDFLRHALELAFLVVSGDPEQDRRRSSVNVPL